MKQPPFEKRNPGDRSKKDCICGGHNANNPKRNLNHNGTRNRLTIRKKRKKALMDPEDVIARVKSREIRQEQTKKIVKARKQRISIGTIQPKLGVFDGVTIHITEDQNQGELDCGRYRYTIQGKDYFIRGT